MLLLAPYEAVACAIVASACRKRSETGIYGPTTLRRREVWSSGAYSICKLCQ